MKAVLQKKETEDVSSARIMELRRRIRDRTYLDYAVQRLAFVMSRQLIESSDVGRKL